MALPTSNRSTAPRGGLAIAAAVTGMTLALGATAASALGWLQAPPTKAVSQPAPIAPIVSQSIVSSPQVVFVPVMADRPASDAGLTVAIVEAEPAAVATASVQRATTSGTGSISPLALETDLTLGEPTFEAVPARLLPRTNTAPVTTSAPFEPVTRTDGAGNVWAWYGSGDWVLIQPAAIPAPRLAAQVREPSKENNEREGRDRSPVTASRAAASDRGITRATSSVRERRGDD